MKVYTLKTGRSPVEQVTLKINEAFVDQGNLRGLIIIDVKNPASDFISKDELFSTVKSWHASRTKDIDTACKNAIKFRGEQYLKVCEQLGKEREQLDEDFKNMAFAIKFYDDLVVCDLRYHQRAKEYLTEPFAPV
jgi:hypothetical protein